MDTNVIRDLGDGLVLRRAASQDVAALTQFNASIHRGTTSPQNQTIAAIVHDMAARQHPTMQASDFTIIEDSRCKQIVSSLCLIPQTWSYAGIPFGVGRPELVGTNPDYRNRGLVRAQFEVIHRWSAERGHLLQGITGIPYYYRQFGYEYALPLAGERTCLSSEIPALKDDENEAVRLRPAQLQDIPFLSETYRAGCRRSLVACVRDEQMWRYEIDGRSPASACYMAIMIIESRDGRPIGYLGHHPRLEHAALGVGQIELSAGSSWASSAAGILRQLQRAGEGIAARDGTSFRELAFWLGEAHPLYQAIPSQLRVKNPDYAWYIRVSDLLAFLRLITPAIEQRLAASAAAGYSGTFKLSFFRSGLLMTWKEGKLSALEDWQPSATEWGSARFPDHTFLQLIFGMHTIDELQHAFPDCRGGNDEVSLVLTTLFPKSYSSVWAIE